MELAKKFVCRFICYFHGSKPHFIAHTRNDFSIWVSRKSCKIFARILLAGSHFSPAGRTMFLFSATCPICEISAHHILIRVRSNIKVRMSIVQSTTQNVLCDFTHPRLIEIMIMIAQMCCKSQINKCTNFMNVHETIFQFVFIFMDFRFYSLLLLPFVMNKT